VREGRLIKLTVTKGPSAIAMPAEIIPTEDRHCLRRDRDVFGREEGDNPKKKFVGIGALWVSSSSLRQ